MDLLLLNATTTTISCNPTFGPYALSAASYTATRLAYASSTATVVLIKHGFDNSHAECNIDYHCGGTLIGNADIGGLGITIAFLLTVYVAVAYLTFAYCLGLLPKDLLTNVDRECFKAHHQRCHDQWKATFEMVTLMFCDQQLVTGLAVMVAGFYAMANQELDVYHFYIVTYLAWTSSTVHLLVISLIRNRFKKSRTLKNIRLVGMLFLLGLLACAMFLSRSYGFLRAAMGNEMEVAGLSDQATPARCFWNPPPSMMDDYDAATSPDVIASFAILFTGYIWKSLNLFEQSHGFLQAWTLTKPRSCLERVTRSWIPSAQSQGVFTLSQTVRYKIIALIYVSFMLLTMCLNAFMATIILLVFALTWATQHLVTVRLHTSRLILQSEWIMSFGQLVPLFLLLQPFLAIIGHLGIKWARHKAIRPASSVPKLAKPGAHPRRLSQALNNMYTPYEMPMEEYLLASKIFRAILYLMYVIIIAFLGIMVWFSSTGNAMSITVSWYYLLTGGICVLPFIAILILCSKKLTG